jgi:hypothetical protein
MTSIVKGLMGSDMKSRLPFDLETLSPDRALDHLEELLGLVDGKSGLFSQAHAPKH